MVRNNGWPDHYPSFILGAIWRWCHPPWTLSSSAGIDDLAGSMTLAEASSQLSLSCVTFPGYQGVWRERAWPPPAAQWVANLDSTRQIRRSLSWLSIPKYQMSSTIAKRLWLFSHAVEMTRKRIAYIYMYMLLNIICIYNIIYTIYYNYI